MNNRRNLIIGAIVAALVIAGGLFWFLNRPADGPAGLASISAEERALMEATQGLPVHAVGSDVAPVRVIEYASPTCPHCATFHNRVYPEFKAQYIETGKVQFIVRPFVRNVLDSVVFMLAEAAGPDNYHTVLETYFRTQPQWAVAERPRDALLAIAKQLGFTDETFDAALENQDLFTKMEAMREEAMSRFDLTGTPTFYINGKKLTGEASVAQLATVIDPLIPANFQPVAVEVPESPVPAPAAADTATPAVPGTTPVEPADEPSAMTPVEPAAEPSAMTPVEPAEEPSAMTPVEPAATDAGTTTPAAGQ